MRTSDFGGLLRTLAADRRTARLIAEGEGVQMFIDVVDGRVVRADDTTTSAWPLGELFVHLGFLRGRHIPRIMGRAQKKEESPESIVLERELVSLPLMKRFRERLTLQNLIKLGLASSFRAEMKQVPVEELEARDWDVEIPIEYALKLINEALEERGQWQGDMPEPEDRFVQREAAVRQMLRAQQEESTPSDALDWTPEVRRIFFLCNGRTPFSVFPMIVGQSRERVARHMEEMLSRGLIDPATRTLSRMDVQERLGGMLRVLSSFGAGLVTVVLMVTLLVQSSKYFKGELSTLPERFEQDFHVQYRDVALAKVEQALYVYKRMEGQYPVSLEDLNKVMGLSENLLSTSTHGGALSYAAEPSGLGYTLSVEERAQELGEP